MLDSVTGTAEQLDLSFREYVRHESWTLHHNRLKTSDFNEISGCRWGRFEARALSGYRVRAPTLEQMSWR
jgi:hypothetical protein